MIYLCRRLMLKLGIFQKDMTSTSATYVYIIIILLYIIVLCKINIPIFLFVFRCMIIKLPVTSNNAMRSFVLGTLRSRMIRGAFPRASELIISEDSMLSANMAPRSIKVNEACILIANVA